MIIFQLLLADFKRLWIGVSLLILLIAMTFALSITIQLQEQGLRVGSARAAEQFDLVIGAPGSETQLVLSTVFLQAGQMSLISMDYQKQLEALPQVQWSAPLAFGDNYKGFPIIGTTANLITEDSKRSAVEGKVFSEGFEAVVGIKTGLKIGDTIQPMHGHGESDGHEGHAHENVNYKVVGILPEQNNAWDKAILVPIETVWDIHGIEHHPILTNIADKEHHADDDHDHDHDDPEHDHEHDNAHNDVHNHQNAKASAFLVKPKSIAGAYQLRSKYRTEQTLAVFPGEVLTKLYSTLGDVQKLFAVISLCTQFIMGFAVILLSVIYLYQRKRDIAVLRIFGAPRKSIFLLIWSGLMMTVIIGLIIGLGLGFVASQIIAHYVSASSGFALPIFITFNEIKMMLSIIIIAAIVLFIPALMSYRVSPLKGINSGG